MGILLQGEEVIDLFGDELPLGKVSRVMEDAILENEQQVLESIAVVRIEDPIELRFLPGSNDVMVATYEDWYPEKYQTSDILKNLDRRYYHSYTPTMKTAISIPDKLFRSADSLAKCLGLSRSQLYAAAVSEFISKYQSNRVTERLNTIYSNEDSSLSPSFIILQARSLYDEEW